MPLLNPYCTVEEVLAELRNDEADITSEVEAAINSASRWIDRYKGRDYFQHDFSSSPLVITAAMNKVFGDTIYLPFSPVITLTAVTIAGETWVQDTDWIEGKNESWETDRLISIVGDWPVSNLPADAIRLTGKFGYAQTTSADVPVGLPENIRKAAVIAAACLSGHNRKETVGLEGSVTSVIDKSIPKSVFELLGARKAFVG